MNTVLSKSDFMLFLSHPCWLWLKKHDKSKLPAVDDNLQARFDSGSALESYAERLFRDGTKLGFDGYDQFISLAACTQAVIADGATTLFQAKFDSDRLSVICDVVELLGDDRVALTEIKSSTSAKPKHVLDLAYQRFVLEQCGFKVERCRVLVVNNKYIRDGEIEADQLFASVDVTAEVEAQLEFVADMIPQALRLMESTEMPNPSPRHCGVVEDSLKNWIPIFKSLLPLPEKSIYDLPALKPQQVAELEDLGVQLIVDIPPSFKLGRTQKPFVEAVREQKIEIHHDRISEFLSQIQYPIYFLDYESFQDALPPYDGTHPYQQLTIQYSLHVLPEPGAELLHFEYIHQSRELPFEPLAQSLRLHIGDEGSVIVWNKTFEVSRNKELGELVPELSNFFDCVNDRVVDLMNVFKQGMYIHPDFMGSSSIKKVLPVLAPKLSYKELEVQEGQTASRLWAEAVMGSKLKSEEKQRLFESLLAYCELDTYAMVKIYEILAQHTKAN
jgi:hypothetical protein